ncbi:MAG: hypothetical protein FJ146_15520 [Deltaproteobacteria bacterium]|nr:hypothetical protein [Deltaproteobacteria bacterium]
MKQIANVLLIAGTFITQVELAWAAQDPPIAKDLTLSIKSFCQQFESYGSQKNLASATAQCIELINSGVSQGRFRFDRVQAMQCLDAQKTNKSSQTCTQVLLGSRKKSETCESSNDCVMPYVCLGAQASQNGSCNLPLEAGATCDDEAVYASKFFAASNRGMCAPGLKCLVGRVQKCSQ